MRIEDTGFLLPHAITKCVADVRRRRTQCGACSKAECWGRVLGREKNGKKRKRSKKRKKRKHTASTLVLEFKHRFLKCGSESLLVEGKRKSKESEQHQRKVLGLCTNCTPACIYLHLPLTLEGQRGLFSESKIVYVPTTPCASERMVSQYQSELSRQLVWNTFVLIFFFSFYLYVRLSLLSAQLLWHCVF